MAEVGAAIVATAKAVAAWLAQEGVKQAIVKAAITAAVSATASKLAADANKPRPQGTLITLDLAGDAPRRWQVGQRGNGGVMADWYSWGDKNQYAAIPVYLSEGPCGNLTGVWSQGRKIWEGVMTHGQRITLTEFNSPDARAWLTYYDGRPGQTADANLVNQAAGWTNDCVGTGCAYVILELRWDPDTVPVIPTMFYETEGAKFYDRRKDTTAGGSGAHRLKDPDTWEVSTNPAVVLDHFLHGTYWSEAQTEPWFGVGLTRPWTYAEFSAQAGVCDEQITLAAGGTQDRYSANGFLFSDRPHRDTIIDLGRAMNARPADLGGLLGVISGEARTPVLTLDDLDRVTGAPESYRPITSLTGLVQRVTGTYQDPDNNYTPTDYPSVGDDAWIVEDGGEIDPTVLDLEMETSSERAQRLAWAYARRKRRMATLKSVFGLKAIILEDGDWFVRTGGKFGAGKTFEVKGSPILDPEALTVVVVAFEIDPSDTAWDELDYQAQDPVVPAPLAVIQLPVPSVTIEPFGYSLGDVTLPAARFINADFDAGLATAVEIDVADDDGQGAPTGDHLAHFIPLGSESSVLTGILPEKDYVARWRAVVGASASQWSSWVQFTSTVAYTVQASTLGGRTAQEILDDIDANAEAVAVDLLSQAAWRQTIEPLLYLEGDTVGTVLTSVKEATDDSVLSLTLLGSRNQTDSAFILNANALIYDAGIQTAKSLLTMRTEHDQSVADIVSLFESVDGQLARWAVNLDVDGNIIGLEAVNTGVPETSSFNIIASNFGIVDPGNGLSSPSIPFSVQSGVVFMPDVVVDTLAAGSVVTDNLVDNSVTDEYFEADTTAHLLSSSKATTVMFDAYFDKVSANSAVRLDFHFTAGSTNGQQFGYVMVYNVYFTPEGGSEVNLDEFIYPATGDSDAYYSNPRTKKYTGLAAGNGRWRILAHVQHEHPRVPTNNATPVGVSNIYIIDMTVNLEETKK